jgi:chromosome segregation ATPase
MNDGSAISSIDITDADYDEILEILKLFIDSDDSFTVDNGDGSCSRIKMSLKSYKRIKELEDDVNEAQAKLEKVIEECDDLKAKYEAECQTNMTLCNYKNLYAESVLECDKWKAAYEYESKKKYRKEAYLNWMHFREECDEWKAKYDAECQQTDILKKTCNDLSKNLEKGLNQYLELKKEYDILLEDRNRLEAQCEKMKSAFETFVKENANAQ